MESDRRGVPSVGRFQEDRREWTRRATRIKRDCKLSDLILVMVIDEAALLLGVMGMMDEVEDEEPPEGIDDIGPDDVPADDDVVEVIVLNAMRMCLSSARGASRAVRD